MQQRSEKQKQASRENGSRSSGATSDSGRQRSSRNSIKHGLTSKAKLFPSDDPQQFQAYLGIQTERFRPADDVEALLVQELATASWRLRVMNDAQIGLVTTQMHFEQSDCAKNFGEDSVNTGIHAGWAFAKLAMRLGNPVSVLSRYVGPLQRQYLAKLKELQELRAARATLRNEPGKQVNYTRPQQHTTNRTRPQPSPEPFLQTPPHIETAVPEPTPPLETAPTA